MWRRFALLQQAERDRDGFLAHRENFLQVILRLGQIGFFGLQGVANLGELRLDVIVRCFVIDRLLQRFHIWIRRPAKSVASIGATAGSTAASSSIAAAAAPATTTTTAKPAKPTDARFSLGSRDLFNPLRNDFPFVIARSEE